MILKRLLPLTLCLLTVGAAHADLIKQNASGGYTRTFLMTDSANPALGKTGLTVAVKLRKVGGTYTASTNAATEVDSTNDPGRYQVVLTATEVNTLGLLDYAFAATGANPDGAHDQIVGFDPSDSSLLGLTGVGTLANQTSILTATTAINTSVAGLSAATLSAIKADSQFNTLLNRQKQRFTYVPSTRLYQPLLDDGATLFGSPITIIVDSNGNILQR